MCVCVQMLQGDGEVLLMFYAEPATNEMLQTMYMCINAGLVWSVVWMVWRGTLLHILSTHAHTLCFSL